MGCGGVHVTRSTSGVSACHRVHHPSPCQLYAGVAQSAWRPDGSTIYHLQLLQFMIGSTAAKIRVRCRALLDSSLSFSFRSVRMLMTNRYYRASNLDTYHRSERVIWWAKRWLSAWVDRMRHGMAVLLLAGFWALLTTSSRLGACLSHADSSSA
jgi:hypothetical protein